jgi:hypothetical protein
MSTGTRPANTETNSTLVITFLALRPIPEALTLKGKVRFASWSQVSVHGHLALLPLGLW